MQTNLIRHFERFAAVAGVSATYARGDDSVDLTVTPAQTAVRNEDASGISVIGKRRDFMVRAVDIKPAGAIVTPEPGDLVRVTVGSQVVVYEVQRLAGEDCYYECDNLGTYLRLHTKCIDREAA